MVRVIAPTTALLIFGVVCCKRNCVKCEDTDNETRIEMEMGSKSFDEDVDGRSRNSSDVANKSTSTSSDSQLISDKSQFSTVNSVNDVGPPSPAPSTTDSLNYNQELISLPIKDRSSSAEYDGDCESTPNHLYRKIIEEIPRRLSGISHMLTDLTNIEGGLYRDSDDNFIESSAEDETLGTPDSFDDEVLSSCHESLVKTRGGSKSSNCNALRRISGHRIKPVKKISSIIADINNSADSYESDNDYFSRSESPYRSSRVNSIENEMAVAPEGSIENLIFKEIYPKVSEGPHCNILDKIDQLASEELQKLSKQIGTFIFEHLWYQITQITPDKPIFVTEAYEFFDLLSEIYAQVISLHELTGIRFEFYQLIEECLKATLVRDFNKFKPVRDAILLLILKYPNYFDDEFLDTLNMHETLKKIVHLSDENEHFDTLEYIRVILSLSNVFDLQQYFEVVLRKPQRKPSDDLFLPLMEDNLIKSLKSNENCITKKNKKNKNEKKSIQKVKKNNLKLSINHLIWENKFAVLTFGLILAIIIQCLFLQK